jgi:pimeloyl-ACP methyl ester carboxylesterase
MASFVLVHGAWHGAWCWDRLVPQLQEAGHEVVAIDLPAHGADRSAPWTVTLRSYAACVVRAARGLSQKPFVVGHSMSGFVITDAAGSQPDAFAGLIYLSAFIPRMGDSLMKLGRQDPGSHVARSVRPGLLGAQIRTGRAQSVFDNTCSASDAAWATDRLGREPVRPLLARLGHEAPSDILRAAIVCSEDRTISVNHQREMASRGSVGQVVTMKTDHSPFLSAPRELADRLGEIAK